MQLPDDTLRDVTRRLHRAEGQVRAVSRMLDEGADCRDVLTQLTAATRALQQAGFRILASGLTTCLQQPDRAAESGYDVAEIERLFLKLG
ncbi:MAG: metal-sensitive transcriptional regulator [Acidimicrobiales bacterium]|nr:metal-sensitive transcriptional regulator [Acidimicrobiales bacterium]